MATDVANSGSAFDSLKNNTITAIQSFFPQEGRKHILKLTDVHVDDKLHAGDVKSQAHAKDNNMTWAVPIKGTLTLVDKVTGKVVDTKKNATLAKLPKLTNRLGFIVGGNEYQVDHLFRLKSGMFTRVQANGELETEFNLKESAGDHKFSVWYDPKKTEFSLKMGSSYIGLYPILKAMGVSDDQLEAQWGKKVLDLNKITDPKKVHSELAKFYSNTSDSETTPTDTAELAKHVGTWFDQASLLPETTKITTGKPFTKVTGEALAVGATKVLGVARGTHKEDERDSLAFKRVASFEEFIPEKIKNNAKIIRGKLRNNIDTKTSISDILSSDTFTRPINDFFLKGSSICERSDQTNPVQMISAFRKTTLMSQEHGGIKNEHQVTNEMRAISNSHFGFIDPAHTPESEKTGITLYLSSLCKKVGEELYAPVVDKITGKVQYFNPHQFHDIEAVLPDQYKIENGKVIPIGKTVKVKTVGGVITEKPFSEIKYLMPSSKGLFDHATNLIPFLPCNQGNRVSMATKQIEQAIGLKHREAPLVQTSKISGTTYENDLGKFTAHASEVDGVVKAVTDDSIVISDGKKTTTHNIYNHFPTNDNKGVIHSTPVVKVGDKVTKGQLIADSNFTQKGTLALGTHLRTAYMPYKGLNYEDGVVISESAAKKLTSEHLHRTELEIDPHFDTISKDKFKAYMATKSNSMTKEHWDALDKDGIIKPGTKVTTGQVMVAAIGKNQNKNTVLVNAFGKKGFTPFKDKSLTWDEDHVGIVQRVVKHPDGKTVKVYVKTEEPAVVGDKMTNRHAAKGIITAILPDHEMPFTKDPSTGDHKHLEVLISPNTVPTRINIGQMLETAAGKIAEKTGKPYIVNNFAGDGHNYVETVRKELQAHGLDDEEHVYDPKDPNKPLGKVSTGPQYILKLRHQVEKKLGVRGGGASSASGKPLAYDIDRQPTKGGELSGQGFGQLEMYSLLSHGAVHNIREFSTYKSDKQDEKFWSMIQQGYEPPPPRVPFAYEKFVGMLKGLGVNVVKEGTAVRMVPMTHKEIVAAADNGRNEIKDGRKTILAKNLSEEKGGLYDPVATGGKDGTKWAYMALPEPVPNPLFVGHHTTLGPVPVLLGLKAADIDNIMNGSKQLNGKTGGHAIEDALKKINVDEALKAVKEELKVKTGNELDHANKKAKFLLALKENNLKPHEAYILKSIPIMPPVFRPITSTNNGNITVPPISGLYKNIAIVGDQIKNFDHKTFGEEGLHNLRYSLWDSVRALQSIGNYKPVLEKGQGENRELTGILDTLGSREGQQPKDAYFQSKLVKHRLNLAIRSTIIPEPTLHLDEVGIPHNAAFELYKPFVVAQMGRWGMNALDAMNELKKTTPFAKRALEKVLEERPLLLKRDPALHKYSVMAFRPRLVEGKAIRIHPLVTGPFNADFDGNCVSGESKIVLQLEQHNVNTSTSTNTVEVCGMKFGPSSKILKQDNGLMVEVEIKDVPFYEHTRVFDKNGASVYDLPKGIKVLSYDHKTGKSGFFSAEKITIEDNCQVAEIETASGIKATVSTNESLCVYDHETEEVVDKSPSDAVGRMSPKVHSVPVEGQFDDYEFGWMLGAYLSDGFITSDKVIGFCKKDDKLRDRFADAVIKFEGADVKRNTYSEMHLAETNEIEGLSIKDHLVNTRKCVELFKDFYADVPGLQSALRKKLPNLSNFSRNTLLGLLTGLIECDGTLCISNGKKNPQVQASFSTSSSFLVEDIKLLGMLLGVRVNATPYDPKPGRLQTHRAYTVSFSIVDIKALLPEMRFTGDHCLEARTLLSSDSAAIKDDRDIVPVPISVLKYLTGPDSPIRDNKQMFRSLQTIKSSRKPYFYVSRPLAVSMLSELRASKFSCDKWASIVESKSIKWDKIESVTQSGSIRVFDLTVPDTKVFAINGGLIVWDTMAGTVPVSKEAVEEAKKMFPSKNVFSATSGDIMYAPNQEMLMGLHLLSKWEKDTNKTFNSVQELEKAVKDGVVGRNDGVRVKGLFNNKPTTFGRVLIESRLPRGFAHNSSILHDKAFEFTKKTLNNVSTDAAKAHPDKYPDIADSLKNLGNDYAYNYAYSFGLRDLVPIKGREAILQAAHAQADKIKKSVSNKDEQDKKVIDVYQKATAELEDAIKKEYGGGKNRLASIVLSGTKGKLEQLRQIVAAPMLMTDTNSKIIPVPVTKSYSEGLDIGNYWNSQFGARKGTMQRALGTSEPGTITKDIINTTMATLITSDDCGTKHGIMMSLHPNEKDNTYKDVHDRLTAIPYKLKDGTNLKEGTLLTPEIISRLKNSKIESVLARSPLKCQHPEGICSKCFGLNENGKLHTVGTNIGTLAGQALGEPTTQLSMDCNASGNIVTVRHNGEVSSMTFEQLWDRINSPVDEDGDVQTKAVTGLEIWDHRDFTKVRLIQRHPPKSPMVIVRLQGGRSFITQSTHPNWATKHVSKCPSCSFEGSIEFVGNSNSNSYGRCASCDSKVTLSNSQYEDQQERVVKSVDLEGLFLPVSGPIPNSSDKNIVLPPYLLGMFLAEGNVRRERVEEDLCSGRKRKHSSPFLLNWKTLGITISQNSGLIKDRIKECLTEHKIDFTEPSDKAVQINDVLLAETIWSSCGTHSSKKCAPPGVFGLSNTEIEEFLAGLIDGDGTIDKDGKTSLYTTSWALASQVQELIRRIGGSSSIVSTTNRELTRNQCFQVYIKYEGHLPTTKKHYPSPKSKTSEYSFYDKVIQVKEILYNGWTYDVSTDSRSFSANGIGTHNSFHSGGIATGKGAGSVDAFTRIGQLTGLPATVKHSATISNSTGSISKIENHPGGGINVHVGSEKYHVPANLVREDLKVGSSVKKGDSLSSGTVNPHHLLAATDINTVQNHLAGEFSKVYDKEGVRRRNVEVVVKAMTNLTRVDDPGSSDHLHGDVARRSVVEDFNRNLPSGKKPIKHSPILKGLEQNPFLANNNWMANLNFNRIQRTIQEAAAKGERADLHSVHPIPGIAAGSEFGKPPQEVKKVKPYAY